MPNQAYVQTLMTDNLVALVVDQGRFGYEDIGVPTAGPFHMPRYLDACFLANTAPGSSVIEMHNGSWEFAVDRDTVIGITGEGAEVSIDGNKLAAGTSLFVSAYSFIKVALPALSRPVGPIYVAINGMSPAKTLGSASFDSFSKLGPTTISRDSKYILNVPSHDGQTRFLQPARYSRSFIPIEPGPWELIKSLFVTHITHKSRSGIRLAPISEKLIKKSDGQVKSFPVMPGAIQLPASNSPIVLGPDAGTTGGYPVVGLISRAYLGVLSELNVGDPITLGLESEGNRGFSEYARHIVPSIRQHGQISS